MPALTDADGGALQELLLTQPPTTRRVATWAMAAMIVAAGAWAYNTQLTEVAVASGAVVPQG